MTEALRHILPLWALMLCCLPALPQPPIPETADIRLFTSQEVTSLQAIPIAGVYTLRNPQGEALLKTNEYDLIVFRAMGQHTQVAINGKSFLLQGPLTLTGSSFENFMVLRPQGFTGRSRTYDDDLQIETRGGTLHIINRIAFQKYLAGVVQAESGWLQHPEFYRVQATIARTYALRAISRHASEGFHLCDQVHCQAYYGRSDYPPIIQGVMITRGDVVVDQNNQLIEAVYHANCGGQTVNSEDLWPEALPYLRSVNDPYCTHMPGASWKATIPVADFARYLQAAFAHTPATAPNPYTSSFSQPARKHHLDEAQRIPLKNIRQHYRLRSTFFSFSQQHQQIHLTGRGYGHGVGLCQEGAMHMAQKGFSADSIIRFYYTGVRVVGREEGVGEINSW